MVSCNAMIKYLSCVVYFDEYGEATDIACIALNEFKKSVLGAKPYILTNVKTIEADLVHRSFKMWLENHFLGTQGEDLSKELEIAWLFYSYEEKRYIDDLLEGKLKKYADEDKSVVVKEVLSFTNHLQTAKSNRYNLANFWRLVSAMRIQHNYRSCTAIQQAYLLPVVVADMCARINCIARY